jgi:phosphotransferase system IIB component
MKKKPDVQAIALDIYKIIKDYKLGDITHCLTRLRLKFDGVNLPTVEVFKKINGVLNAVKIENEYQIILGLGLVDDVFSEINKLIILEKQDYSTVSQSAPHTEVTTTNTNTSNQKTFEENKKRFKNNVIAQTLMKFSKIFSPLIPAFVGAGIISGIACIIQICAPDIVTNDVKHLVASQ